MPPTAPPTAAASARARPASGVSMAKRMGLRFMLAVSQRRMLAGMPDIVERQPRRREVLDRRADRFEQGDLVVIAPAGAAAARQVEQVAGDVVVAQHTRFERLDDVAGLREGAGARIDEDARPADAVIIRFAHV